MYICCTSHTVLTSHAAFEYSKRKFGKKYGKQIPVWALLASGSTGGVRPTILILLARQLTDNPQIAYWLSCYPLGTVQHFISLRSKSLTRLFSDVVKSRVQLRPTPPEGTPVQYIARELRSVVAEGGACVLSPVSLRSYRSSKFPTSQIWSVPRTDTIM